MWIYPQLMRSSCLMHQKLPGSSKLSHLFASSAISTVIFGFGAFGSKLLVEYGFQSFCQNSTLFESMYRRNMAQESHLPYILHRIHAAAWFNCRQISILKHAYDVICSKTSLPTWEPKWEKHRPIPSISEQLFGPSMSWSSFLNAEMCFGTFGSSWCYHLNDQLIP